MNNNTIEILKCPKCRDDIVADSNDLGTYFCQRCEKPKLIDYTHLSKFLKDSFKENIERRDTWRRQNGK